MEVVDSETFLIVLAVLVPLLTWIVVRDIRLSSKFGREMRTK